MKQPNDSKRGPRIATDFKAKLFRSGGEEHDVVITDISKEGFKLSTGIQLSIGERVDLRVPKTGDVPAEIRWALSNAAGGVFLAPLPLRALG